jgi:PAS domain S-box-containing protein
MSELKDQLTNISNEDLLEIIDHSLQGITIASGELPIVVFANKTLEDTFGYTADELKKFTPEQINALIHPDDRELFFGRYQARIKGEKVPARYKVRVINKQGETRLVEVSSIKIVFDGKPAVQTNYYDITEQQSNLEELANKISLIDSILPAMHSGLLVVSKENKIVLVNKKFLEMWEVPDELVNTIDDSKMLEYVTKQLADPNLFLDKVKYLYSQPSESSNDVLKLASGKVFQRMSHPQIKNGEVVGRVWSFYDMTAEYEANNAREALMTKYEVATNVTGQIFYEYNTATGDINWVGPVERVLGYTPEEFESVNINKWADMIHPEDKKRAVEILGKAEREIGQYRCEYRFKKKMDGYAKILDEGTYLVDKETGKIRMIGSMRNISP